MTNPGKNSIASLLRSHEPLGYDDYDAIYDGEALYTFRNIRRRCFRTGAIYPSIVVILALLAMLVLVIVYFSRNHKSEIRVVQTHVIINDIASYLNIIVQHKVPICIGNFSWRMKYGSFWS
jgi:hypothetical protein